MPRRLIRLTGLVVAVLVSLWAVALFPRLVFPTLAFWIVAICLDVRSTWQIYQLDPGKFTQIESNIFFTTLYRRLGFTWSVPAFLVLVEIPRFIFIAFFLAHFVGAVFLLGTSYFEGIGVAAAAQGYAHFDGWAANRRFLR